MYKKYLLNLQKIYISYHNPSSVFVYILVGVQEVRIGGVQRLLL
jgi:hypothetical protein